MMNLDQDRRTSVQVVTVGFSYRPGTLFQGLAKECGICGMGAELGN